MSGGSEMRDLQEDLEYQQVYEDQEVRIYMSVVRSDERDEKVQSHRNKRHIRWAVIGAFVLAEAALAIGAGLGVNAWISGIVEAKRGYSAMGSEIFVGPLAAGVVAVIAEALLGGVAALENELN